MVSLAKICIYDEGLLYRAELGSVLCWASSIGLMLWCRYCKCTYRWAKPQGN